MEYLYKSTTGLTENIGSYVVSVTGIGLLERVPALDEQVGKTIEVIVEAPEVEEISVVAEEPVVEEIVEEPVIEIVQIPVV